jgi:uroporphyrinogen-III decarboxylase
MWTPRERWLSLLRGERPDRVPTDYWATPEVTARLMRDLGCATQEDLFRRQVASTDGRRAVRCGGYEPFLLYCKLRGMEQAYMDLLDVTGIEILNPIQWRCPGMEREGLVRDFGARVVFHGAVDNQQTLAFGTPGDVRREVLDNLRIFAPPARWICAPCHNLQPVSPTANVVALYETAHAHGRLA